MKDIFSMSYAAFKRFEAKILLDSYKKDNVKLLFILTVTAFICFNLIYLIPALAVYSIVAPSMMLSAVTLIFAAAVFLIYRKKVPVIPKSEKKISNLTAVPPDFLFFLRNDLSFSFRASILTAGLLSLYQMVIYLPFIFIRPGIGISKYLSISAIYIIAFFFISITSFFCLYLSKRDPKFASAKQTAKNENKVKALALSIISFFSFFAFMLASFLIIGDVPNAVIASFMFAALAAYLSNKLLTNTCFFKSADIVSYRSKLNSAFFKDFSFKRMFSPASIRRTISLTYPIFIFTAVALFLGIFSKLFGVKIILFQSAIFTMFFVFPLIKMKYGKDKNDNIFKPFIFTSLIFAFILFLITFSLVTVKIDLSQGRLLYSFRDFILPFQDSVNTFSLAASNLIYMTNTIYFLFIPVLFILIYLFNKRAYAFSHFIGENIDRDLRKKLSKENPSIVFGDSLSLYPFLFILIGNLLLLALISIELKPISNLFYNLFTTFEIPEVFKLNFINLSSISFFFTAVFYIILAVTLLKLALLFFSNFLSHFIMFEDELVYYENKLYKKTILRIPLSRVNYMVCRQNIFERIFDIGAIYIETMDKNGLIKIKGVPSLREKNIIIMDKIKSDL